MDWIGITGGISSGKSSVSRFLKSTGFPVIVADDVNHSVMSPEGLAYGPIIEEFGRDILNGIGHIDRKMLGAKVFGNATRLRDLELILHPLIQKKVSGWRKKRQDEGHEVAFYEIPLLFEKNLENNFDKIILISSPEELRLERLMKRDNLDEIQAQKRINHQMKDEVKIDRSDFVIYNEGSLDDLEKKSRKGLRGAWLLAEGILMQLLVRFFCFIIVGLLSLPAYSGETINLSIHRKWESPRALGMGGAIVAAADDYNALYMNPAGLATLETWYLNMSLAQLSFATDIFSILNDISNADSPSSPGETDPTQTTIEALQAAYGTFHSFRATMLEGILVGPNYGIGVAPLVASAEISIHKQGTPAFNMDFYLDTIISYGQADEYAWLEDAQITLGWTAHLINRAQVSKSINSVELVARSDDLFSTADAREGITLDADVGIMYTPEIPEEGIFSILRWAKPTFGAVVRNVLDYGFSLDANVYNPGENKQPDPLYRRLDIGTKWEYPEFWIFGGRGVMDFRDIGHPNANIAKTIHLGFEFDWTVFSWWNGQYRVGINQGYWTAGFTWLFTVFKLDFATWGEEVLTTSNPKESRRFLIKLNIDI